MKQPGFNNIGYFSTGVSASTRLFGIMQPNIFGITAFRHTLQPSITLTYQPDFSKPSGNITDIIRLSTETRHNTIITPQESTVVRHPELSHLLVSTSAIILK